MSVLGELIKLLRGPAEESMRGVSEERRRFREDLVSQLRQYSVLVERVRSAFLSIYDSLPESPEHTILEPSEASALVALADAEYENDGTLALPSDIQRFLDSNPPPRLSGDVGASALERIELTIDRLEQLDAAWSELRPRLDEALELSAVTYLRTYRHEFRRLTLAAVAIATVPRGRSAPDDVTVRMYCEAVLFAADAWNHHVVGTIEKFTPIKKRR